jgi:hypothetical protein
LNIATQVKTAVLEASIQFKAEITQAGFYIDASMPWCCFNMFSSLRIC